MCLGDELDKSLKNTFRGGGPRAHSLGGRGKRSGVPLGCRPHHRENLSAVPLAASHLPPILKGCRKWVRCGGLAHPRGSIVDPMVRKERKGNVPPREGHRLEVGCGGPTGRKGRGLPVGRAALQLGAASVSLVMTHPATHAPCWRG
ncbi:hypothetical protein GWK47_017446 [Chionoecetes opilio]|uniref:Uncharacterized protein n=1 Tax=Chionoecetes opilio TaxID=41210 RepID=A0A8J4XVX4_CHIOP|nr:hypothetical protein GWK47_017446 [Chionoecetes opilio]